MGKQSGVAKVAVFCIGACFLACSPTNSSKATTVTMLKINSGDISGWTISSYNIYYSAQSWGSTSVDGDAYNFQQTVSYSEVMDEHMAGSSGKTITIWILNYTTPENASTQYNVDKTNWSANLDQLSAYSDTVAVGNNSHTDGVYAIAHFKKFYIQIRFSGYTDYALSKQDAVSFLGFLEAKI
jgi:hypothetical protein